MNCPTCTTEMRSGLVQTMGALAFTEEKRHVLRESRGDVRISTGRLGGRPLPGFICEDCHLAVLHYEPGD
ncbi:MAG: PF20097 family protein [Mobilicoccus sp.]|nr:PF20097 family protein [Mobilicoccus sp.]